MELTFKTHDKIELIDITERVEEIVEKSNVSDGICVIHAPHATAAIILNENEPGLLSDIKSYIFDEFFSRDYAHNQIDNNGAAHLASVVIGSTKVIPIKDGRLLRGTWQDILFVELDGPRSLRRVVVWIQKKK